MTTGTTVGLAIIVLHLIIGFGYMIYMLAPRKSDHPIDLSDKTEE